MRVIILGDLHYSKYSDPAAAASRDRFFEGFFRQVVEQRADLVFAIGDTTNEGTLDELTGQTDLTRRVGLDLIRTTGNHDTNSLDKTELAPFFLGGRPSVAADELYASFDDGLGRFVLLDTARSKMSHINWSGFVTDEQLAWLGSQIEGFNRAEGPRYLVVLGHHPLFDTTDRSTKQWLNIDNSPVVKAEFSKLTRLPGLYICGHNHSNSLAGPDNEGWYYVQAGAPLVCQSYRLLTLDETGIRVETIDIDLSDPELRADFETTRYSIEEGFSVAPLEAMYGGESDLRMTIPALAKA